METKFTVVPTKNIQLTFNYVSCVSASWSRPIVTCLNFFPVICINIKNMYIIHPVNSIVTTEVVNFRVN